MPTIETVFDSPARATTQLAVRSIPQNLTDVSFIFDTTKDTTKNSKCQKTFELKTAEFHGIFCIEGASHHRDKASNLSKYLLFTEVENYQTLWKS